MSDAKDILARIGNALRIATRADLRDPSATPVSTESDSVRSLLPQAGPDYASWKESFASHSAALQTEFRVVPDLESMHALLREMAGEHRWEKVGYHRGPMVEAACGELGLPSCCTDGGYEKDDLEACDVGVTECEALIAQTGSILITSRSSGGRALSVLPPHHVLLARQDQLLPDLTAGYALLKRKYHGAYPSLISFITGPSRTGDIERILVLGAHGPRRLTVILVENDSRNSMRTGQT